MATQPSGLLDSPLLEKGPPTQTDLVREAQRAGKLRGTLRSPKEAGGTMETSWPQLPTWCGLSPAPTPSCGTQVSKMGSCRGAQEDKTGEGA